MKGAKGALLFVLTLALAGCAHVDALKVGARVPRDQPCAAFLEALRETVEEHGVRDASTAVVPVFPYLRVNRFYEALWERAREDDQREQWVGGLRQLFRDSLRKELRNLPIDLHARASGDRFPVTDTEAAIERAEACSDVLVEYDRALPGFHGLVASLARVPDEYSTLMRTVGLYPLASLPVIAVTDRVRNKVRRTFAMSLDRLPVLGALTAYRPTQWSRRPEGVIREIIRAASDNPLGVPILDPDQQRELAHDFAPLFWVDVAGMQDQPGGIVARKSGFEVDRGRPTIYYYCSNAFKGDRPILQVNYVIWFPERIGKQAPRIEWGCLDGLTVRLSLNPDGRPFMMDVMNNCGCYHFFVPDRDTVARVKPKRFKLDPFVPQWLPGPASSGRFGLRVSSGWHQVERVLSVEGPIEEARAYELRPYEELESMMGPRGSSVSLFSGRGVAKGSGRIEPLIFFPMGIPSVGSMRQRGHHAIDLVGRAHFDDPHLFNRSFVFK